MKKRLWIAAIHKRLFPRAAGQYKIILLIIIFSYFGIMGLASSIRMANVILTPTPSSILMQLIMRGNLIGALILLTSLKHKKIQKESALTIVPAIISPIKN